MCLIRPKMIFFKKYPQNFPKDIDVSSLRPGSWPNFDPIYESTQSPRSLSEFGQFHSTSVSCLPPNNVAVSRTKKPHRSPRVTHPTRPLLFSNLEPKKQIQIFTLNDSTMHRFRPSLLIHRRSLHHLQNAGPLCSHLKSRSVIRFSGPDTIKFLQGLLTNDVRRFGEPPSEDNTPIPAPNVASVVVPPAYAALLTPQGRFLYDFFLYRPPRPEEKLDRTGSGPGSVSGGSPEILADVDGSVLDELLATLKKWVFFSLYFLKRLNFCNYIDFHRTVFICL